MTQRYSLVMPVPTLEDGRPVDWVPTSVTEEEWGTLRVSVYPDGGTPEDVTEFRGVACEVVSWSYGDPLADEAAVVRFPQITPFDALGVGDLDWLTAWANIDIERVHPDDSTTMLWEGLIASWDWEQDERGQSLTVSAMGCLQQVGLFKRSPKANRNADSLEVIMDNEFASTTNRASLRNNALVVTGGPTGIEFVHRPAWIDARSFVLEMLGRSAIDGGTDQWTIQKIAPRTPNLIKRSAFGDTYTMTVGTPGLTLRLSQDFSETRNVIYGEGVDTFGGGGKHRNFYLKPEEYFQPYAYDVDVHGFDEGANGSIVDNTARVDTGIVRIEDHINFGEGVSLEEAKAIAAQYVARDSTPGITGTAVLRSDPEEGSRFDLVAGDRFKAKQLAGSGDTGTTFNIAHVNVDWERGAVTLALDTKNRDWEVLEKILERNREGQSPARRMQIGRDSGQISEAKFPWDDSNGAGWVPRERKFNGTSAVTLPANTWVIQEIIGSEGPDEIIKSEFYASTAAEFHVSVYDWGITSTDLPSDPFAAGAWDEPPVGFQVGWGHFDWIPVETLIDETPWTFTHSRGTPGDVGSLNDSGSPARLWVAMRAKTACTMHGRLYHGAGS